MFESIKGKRILITGATGGIGSALAELFADYGAHLGLHYVKNHKKALNLLKKTREKTSSEIFKANLLKSKEVMNLAKSFIKKLGGIDVLINNAGSYNHIDFRSLDEKFWQNTFDLNVKAPFILSRDVFNYLKDQGGGRIINISSVNVKYGGSGKSLHYIASKAALESVTRTLAKEGAKYNILVNAIRPGLIDTPMRTKIKNYSEKDFLKRMELVLLKRAGKPIDVAQMALFLASEAGDFITGEIFTVAGGD